MRNEHEQTELSARDPWREPLTYRNSWPHEYVSQKKVGQPKMLNTVYKHLFSGDFKYWFSSQWDGFEPDDENVINRARVDWAHRDFVIQRGDSGKAEDYPMNPARQS